MVSNNKNTRIQDGNGSNGGAVAGERFSIAQLRSAIRGRVISPDDAGYDEARTLFYGGFEQRPAVFAFPADETDVARIVSMARETGLPLAVRSGGHSLAGHSLVEGGIVLNLRDMRSLQIDAEERTAWAETGLTAAEYSAAAGAHGLATGFGDTGSVGIGGITLGGGVGFLARKYGLSIDSLLAADIVTADGQLRRADAQTNPDLFWAIRGGGGNFGVATRFQFRLHPVGDVLGGMLILPATPEVITAFIKEAGAAPEELSTIANIMPAPPMPFFPAVMHGKMILMGMMVYAGPPEEGQRVVAPFRSIAKPLADMLRPMPYPEIFPPEESGYHPTAVSHNMFIQRVDRGTAETIIDYLQSSDAALRVAQLRVLGGAVSRVPDDATAYAHRAAPIMANLAAFYNGPDDRSARETWLKNFARDIDQGVSGAYSNFVGGEGEQRIHAAYPPATWQRLAEVKTRYDPENLFRSNHNIPPARSGRG